MLNAPEPAISAHCPGMFGRREERWCMNLRECYPGPDSPVSKQEYQEALAIAEAVIRWVEERIL